MLISSSNRHSITMFKNIGTRQFIFKLSIQQSKWIIIFVSIGLHAQLSVYISVEPYKSGDNRLSYFIIPHSSVSFSLHFVSIHKADLNNAKLSNRLWRCSSRLIRPFLNYWRVSFGAAFDLSTGIYQQRRNPYIASKTSKTPPLTS